MENKWHSNGLKEKEAKKLNKKYARIASPIYGFLKDLESLGLEFILKDEEGQSTPTYLGKHEDIKQLLIETTSRNVSQLEGKIVEVYFQNTMLKGISVNENLIWEYLSE